MNKGMHTMNMPPPVDPQQTVGPSQKSDHKEPMGLRTRIALGGFLGIAAFFLLTKHWAHVWPLLPYLFFLACPVMHFFHHHGHGGHDAGTDTQGGPAQTAGAAPQEGRP